VVMLMLGLLVTACGSSDHTSAVSHASLTTGKNVVTFSGVELTVPTAWPVIDGAHAHHSCSSTFAGQADKVFLGVSYQGVPSCPASFGAPPPVDGVWMQPGGSKPSDETPTTLPDGQAVYLSTNSRSASVTVWYHRVSIQIGIGPDPAVERTILNSIAFAPTAPDSAVLGRCPAPQPSPPLMPVPARVTTSLTLGDGSAHIQPEPSNIRPRVSASAVWTSLFQIFGAGGFAGPLRWSIAFGSYSAQTPAHINADGTTTPEYQDTPTWLIQGEGIKTAYGPCGITVLAPYNANTGSAMGVETIG
jgi:hypothetical protein